MSATPEPCRVVSFSLLGARAVPVEVELQHAGGLMQRIIMTGDVPSPINPPTGCSFHPRCRYAQPVCSESIPEWKEYSPGHFTACHFAEELKLKGASK